MIICLRISLREKQYGINGTAGSGDAGDNAGNPYFTAALYENFYGRADKLAKGFTRAELAYIQTAAPLRVVGDADNYPMEWLDGKTAFIKALIRMC